MRNYELLRHPGLVSKKYFGGLNLFHLKNLFFSTDGGILFHFPTLLSLFILHAWSRPNYRVTQHLASSTSPRSVLNNIPYGSTHKPNMINCARLLLVIAGTSQVGAFLVPPAPTAARTAVTRLNFGFNGLGSPPDDKKKASAEEPEKKITGKGLFQLIAAGMGAPFLGDFEGVDNVSTIGGYQYFYSDIFVSKLTLDSHVLLLVLFVQRVLCYCFLRCYCIRLLNAGWEDDVHAGG